MPARNPEREAELIRILDAYADQKANTDKARKSRAMKPADAATWLVAARANAVSSILNATRAPSGQRKP